MFAFLLIHTKAIVTTFTVHRQNQVEKTRVLLQYLQNSPPSSLCKIENSQRHENSLKQLLDSTTFKPINSY